MKVNDVLKHSNATKIAVRENHEDFSTLCMIDYFLKEESVKTCEAYTTYGGRAFTPKEYLNLTVDFFSADNVGRITIYVK